MKRERAMEKEEWKVPHSVQDCIPVKRVWEDGIFQTGHAYSRCWQFTDINYLAAGKEEQERMFLKYAEILNGLDSGADTKVTVMNGRLRRRDFEKDLLMAYRDDGLDPYREEYNGMLLSKALHGSGIRQDKYLTVTLQKRNVGEARAVFARMETELLPRFAALGSRLTPLDGTERLRILRDFYRKEEEEEAFSFDWKEHVRLGHSFRDCICPDSMEKGVDCMKVGNRHVRVLFLKDYASYIRDTLVSELLEQNRNLVLSMDILPVPTEDTVYR